MTRTLDDVKRKLTDWAENLERNATTYEGRISANDASRCRVRAQDLRDVLELLGELDPDA